MLAFRSLDTGISSRAYFYCLLCWIPKEVMEESVLRKRQPESPFLRAHVIAFELLLLIAVLIEGIKYLVFLVKR